METEEHIPTAEEIAADTEAQAEVEESKVRETVASDLGIADDSTNKDLLDKLTKRELDNRTRLSKAVGQKIKYRDLIGGKKPATTDKPKQDNRTPEQIVEERFMQRDLDDMDHSDTVKDQIKKIAQMQGISIRKAEQDSYIQHVITEEARQKSVLDAAKNGKGSSKTGTVIDVSKPLDVSQFNLATPEGRAEWAEAKQAKRDALK